jgi:hypothetical protein
MIKARAKSGIVDRVEGSRVARRNAARNARRGITTSSKPTDQEITREVQKKTHQRAVKELQQTIQQQQSNTTTTRGGKKKKVTFNNNNNDNTLMDIEPPAGKNKLKEKLDLRQQQRAVKEAEKHLPDYIPRPTRAMIQAAKDAMEQKGYIFPLHTTLHVVPMPGKGGGGKSPLGKVPAIVVPPPPPRHTPRRPNQRGGGGGRGGTK